MTDETSPAEHRPMTGLGAAESDDHAHPRRGNLHHRHHERRRHRRPFEGLPLALLTHTRGLVPAAQPAQRQDVEAQAYRETSDRYTARFAGGQPILADHHSAASAIRDQQKGHAAMRRAIDTQRHADETARRATAAAHATDARYNPVTVANRIARLEADARRITRQIDGHARTVSITAAGEKVTETMPPATGQHAEKLWTRREELDAQLAYWHGIRDTQTATGEATSHSRETISAGDAVKISGHWYRVTRANAKTVTVTTEYGTQKAPYARLQDHKRCE